MSVHDSPPQETLWVVLQGVALPSAPVFNPLPEVRKLVPPCRAVRLLTAGHLSSPLHTVWTKTNRERSCQTCLSEQTKACSFLMSKQTALILSSDDNIYSQTNFSSGIKCFILSSCCIGVPMGNSVLYQH